MLHGRVGSNQSGARVALTHVLTNEATHRNPSPIPDRLAAPSL
jgi:hypothetical protein